MQGSIRDQIQSAWSAAWDRGELDALDALVTDDYVRESAGSGTTTDLDGLKREIASVRDAFPDLSTHIESLVLDGDAGAIFWRTEGTFTEPLGDVPATGNRVVTRGSNALELRDGRIALERVTWDAGGLLADLGVPSLASAFEPAAEEQTDQVAGVLDPQLVRGFNRQFITGVTVVTTTDAEGRPRGLAANSYASVSVDPPLVLVCVQKTSSTHPVLFSSTHLGINILSAEQADVVATFAGKSPDKFAELTWAPGPDGSPLIEGSAARLEAEIKERLQTKTHTVFIGRVRHADVEEVAPMVYRAGRFFDGGQLTAL